MNCICVRNFLVFHFIFKIGKPISRHEVDANLHDEHMSIVDTENQCNFWINFVDHFVRNIHNASKGGHHHTEEPHYPWQDSPWGLRYEPTCLEAFEGF